MTTQTLFSGISYNQNRAGPPVPANTVVNAGALVTHVEFALTVTPSTGWAEAQINWGPDGVNFPGQMTIYEAPTGNGTTTLGVRPHGGALEPAAGGNDGAQYFKAELTKIAPGAAATLTATY
jgi:hypothetical protein